MSKHSHALFMPEAFRVFGVVAGMLGAARCRSSLWVSTMAVGTCPTRRRGEERNRTFWPGREIMHTI